jgi:sterol 3beta-glucosyltransferase
MVCHHGGAGTTSTALRYGRPNIIIPFFGDQPFWGQTVFEVFFIFFSHFFI